MADQEQGVTQQQDNDWDTTSSGGNLYKWEKPGQSVLGVLMGKRVVKTRQGDMTVYDLLTKNGPLPVPGTKGLNTEMTYIKVGKLVQMTFEKEVPGAFASPFKSFVVRAAEPTPERLAKHGIDASLIDDDGFGDSPSAA